MPYCDDCGKRRHVRDGLCATCRGLYGFPKTLASGFEAHNAGDLDFDAMICARFDADGRDRLLRPRRDRLAQPRQGHQDAAGAVQTT